MYESFYGFREKPFSLHPDPDFFYRSGQHTAALSLLEYGLFNRSGFVVITGEIGTGKSLLLRKMMDDAGKKFIIGVISNTHGNFQSLAQWIPEVFNLRTRSKSNPTVYRKLSEYLNRQHSLNRRVVLAVDEAQNLGPVMLEELRLLSNMNSGKKQLLQIVLSGQPGLRDLLRRPDMAQFAQRIDAEYHLMPMNAEETDQYIRHRIKTAGREDPLFEDEALFLVYRITGGVPRLINQACERALVYGYAESAKRISSRLVAEAASDRLAGNLLPLAGNVDLAPFLGETDHKVRTHGGNGSTPRGESSIPDEMPGGRSNADYRRGMELRQAGRYDEAIRSFENAARDRSYWLKAFFLAGLCHQAAGRIEEALQSCRTALADHSAPVREMAKVRYEMGRILEDHGRTEEALDCYRRVRILEDGLGDVNDRIERLVKAQALTGFRIRRISKKSGNLARAAVMFMKGSLLKFNRFLISR